MKRPALAILFLCLLYGGSARKPTRVHRPLSVAVTPKVGKVLIKLSEGILSEAVYEHNVGEIKDNELKNVLLRYSVHSLQSIFENRYTDSGCLKHEVISSGKQLLSSWFEVSLADKFDARELLEALKKQQSVVSVLLDVPLQTRPDIVPDDDSYAFQWHLNNPDNQNFDIDAEAAWDINTGRNDVIIAVLDGGIDYTHTDLDPGDRSRIISGIDTGDDDSDPMDDLPTDSDDSFAGHGTAIAGVIGAIANNNQEVSGVMWNCRIMPVKMVRSGGIRIPHIYDWDWSTSAFPSDVADAIDYAVNNGADVINLSYSFPDMGYLWHVNRWESDLIAKYIIRLFCL